MKKWKMVVFIALCLSVAMVTINTSRIPVYAYTQEQKDAAKAWLEANGYPPTRAGAEQAYQDYLDGKINPFGEKDEVTVPTESIVEEAVAETQVIQEETVVENVTEGKEASGNVRTTKELESVEKVTTEEMTHEPVSEKVAELAQSEEASSLSESLIEEGTADLGETESEGVTDAETDSLAEEGGVHMGRFDGVIVVIATVACVAMIIFTVRYIKKEKKDGA